MTVFRRPIAVVMTRKITAGVGEADYIIAHFEKQNEISYSSEGSFDTLSW